MPFRAWTAPAALASLAVALAVRLLHVWQMRGTPYFTVLMGDSRGYDAWARELAAGDWIGRDVFYQAPLYPYVLGVVYRLVGEDPLGARVVQAGLGAASCMALSVAAARLVSPRAGLVAGLMLALYPPAIFSDGLIQKSVLDVLFVCLALAIAGRIVADGPTPPRWLLLGATMGALALTRENALLLVAIVALWAWSAAGSAAPTKHLEPASVPSAPFARFTSFAPFVSIVYVASFTAGIAAVLLPVAARNYAVGGGFYLTTSQFGSNLYIGNNPRADGSYVALRDGRGSPEYERVDATELAEQAVGRRLTASEVSSYWTGRALAYIASDPGDWLRLLGRKLRLLVSSTEVIDTESQESHAEHSWPLAVLGHLWHFGVLLPLAALGAFALWPQRSRLWPLYALAAAYAASVLLFFVVARYRLPVVPFLVVFAAAGTDPAAWRAGAAPGRTLRLPTAAWAAALALAIAANWPLYTAASQQAITETNLGAALQEQGRTDDAIARYRRALALTPGYVPALNNLGTALRAAGKADQAVAVYDQALESGGERATTLLNRGNALMSQGRIAEAVASFRQAAAIDPRSKEAAGALARALYDQGTTALEAGAFAAAADALREAIAVTPDYAEAHNNLGIALASQGRLPDAIVEWETALTLRPDFADARRNLELARRR